MPNNFRKFQIFYILFFISSVEIEALFRMNKITCEVSDKTLIEFSYCRLKPIDRNQSKVSLKAHLHKTVEELWVHLELFQKYSSQAYRLFYVNVSADMCDYLKHKKRYPIVDVIYKLFENFTNLNHCPIREDIYLEGFYLDASLLPVVLPSAEFLLKIDFLANKKNHVKVNVGFIFEEDRKRIPKPMFTNIG